APCNAFVAQFVGETNFLPCRAADGRLWLGQVPLDAAAPAAAGPGWQGRLALRPDYLVRAAPGTAGPRLDCTVSDVAVHGGSFRCLAEADGIGRVIVREQGGDGRQPPQPGERVALTFDVGRAVLLDD